jgi:hypothetical protein
LWIAGLWLGLLLASWVSATASFRGVDRVLGPGSPPELESRLAGVAPAERRVVLRYLASEINRWMFRRWALVQVGLATALLLLAWGVGMPVRIVVGLAFVIVLAQTFALGPGIETLGRSLDFVPRPLPADVARRFGILHAGFLGLDLVKAGLLIASAWLLGRRSLL